MSRCEVTLSYLAALMGRVNEAPAAVPSVLSPARHVVRERTKLHTGTIESGTNRCDILDSSFLMVLGETSFSQFYRHNSRTHQEFRLSSGNHLKGDVYKKEKLKVKTDLQKNNRGWIPNVNLRSVSE
ncbi:hypothetical protein F2P81_007719 [Scophthalmus maximus]|uniref:Uncharacterized protein n=1 Tax=Scophthalmus maximus TaxID=52904 RepID=A0A6A4T8J3_SCOMX|nr:hypothetical protein F2P81_007719 [Scophthalmus maximus]